MTEDYEWELCLGCGYMVCCKKCGMNTCGGGTGENPDGSDCEDCAKARAWWLEHMDECKAMNKRDHAMIQDEREKARQRFIDDGGKFASLEDLRNI